MYGPTSEAWRLNREATLLLGAGPRALLLQIAHPLVAEGVSQHSDFRADPWSRLAGTVASYLRIVYGTTVAARAEIRRLNALHRPIGGAVQNPDARARFGRAYAARDPELSLWVHATLVDATITAVDAWQEPLGRDRRAAYYAETRPIGRAFGIPDALLPADLEAFERYLGAMLGDDGPVHPTPTARELAEVILHPPLRPLVERGPLAGRLGSWRAPMAALAERVPTPAYDWALLPALALLPDRQRAEYGVRWGPAERAVAAWVTAVWRAARPMLPAGLRTFPQARRADRRMALAQSRLGKRAA
ncbi:MAG TPA: oxygenase MpaB family protein [Candidatus Limnocylindrales bacterium]|nr:oxygenase MpaB family protein [Candidatus Limnocylindrales bacterium]